MDQANWKTLIMPKEVRIGEQDKNYTRFICEPLMKGYGTTLGNALRRILISSLRGAAVVGVKIKGVEHEFATIPGIKEDVVDIILNIKQIRFIAHEDANQTLFLKRNTKGQVFAGDIEENSGISILNKDLYLFTMDEGVDFEMELLVTIGRGYVPSESHDPDLFGEGFIPVDSFFSPVVRANYQISNARVKNSFDYDKLTFDLETDGSLSPREALAYAAMILREHTKFLINFTGCEDELEDIHQEEPEVISDVDMNLYRPISEFVNLSIRSKNCLREANIVYIGELASRTEAEMLKTKNFGRTSLKELKTLLNSLGLDFGMEIPGFPDSRIIEQIEKGTGSK